MKLCFISTMNGASWGGSESLWADAAAAAMQAGHAVAIVTYAWPHLAGPLLQLKRKGALLLHQRRQPGCFGRKLEKVVTLWPKLRRWRPDAICVSQGNCFDLALQWQVARGIKILAAPYTVLCQHNFDDRVLSDAVRLAARDLFQQASCVAFVAERNREIAERQLACCLDHATILRNPVNVRVDGPLPWPQSTGIVEFASVARLEANFKGQDVLLDVLSRSPWTDRPWKLTFYGEGPDRAYLGDLAASRGLGHKVSFAGFVSDIDSVWRKSHLQLLPSRSEGTPLSLVEAMLCGRPAVVTDVGGNREWVHEPDNGFTAEAASRCSFGAALERAWAARSQWPAMGLQAHHTADQLVDRKPGHSLLQLLLRAVEVLSP